ncbi:hypothetical protein V3F60_004060 [Salmonella enterica]
MGWKRKYIEEPMMPPAFPFHKWFYCLFLSCFVLLAIYLFFNEKIFSDNEFMLFSFSLLAFLFFIFSMQLYFYAKYEYDVRCRVEHIHSIKQKWEDWGSRYVSVLDLKLYLPGEISASSLSNSESEAKYELTERINYLKWKENDWFSFFVNLSKEINIHRLPDKVTKEFIIITDSHVDEYHQIERDFFSALQKINITKKSYPLHIVSVMSFEQLDSWLKVTEDKIFIVLVLQLNGQKNYSDGVAVFLFATDDIVRKYQLTEKVRICRPMVVIKNTFDKDMDIFVDTQKNALKAKGLVGDCSDLLKISDNILQCFCPPKGQLQVENIHILESFSGIPGANSAWLTAALTTSIVNYKQSEYLMMAKFNDDWIIATIYPTEGS